MFLSEAMFIAKTPAESGNATLAHIPADVKTENPEQCH